VRHGRVCAPSPASATPSPSRRSASGNALDKTPIDAWGIDEFVTGKIGAHLGQRFEVKKIAAPKRAFASLEKPKSPFADNSKDDDRKEIIRGILGAQKCDLAIVVTKSGSMVGDTNQAVLGLGVVDASSLIFVDNVWLFALSEIRVYDGKSFAVLGHKRSYTWQPSLGGVVIRGPSRQVGKTGWPGSPANAERDAKLKQATMELLEQSMATMIADLFPEAQASAKR
jgi:hypothetical protein